MRLDNRGPGSPSGRRRWAFRPTSEGLEDRQLLATLDLGLIQTAPAATNPGVELIGKSVSNGAGYTVTDVGDVNGSGFDSYVIASPSINNPSTTGVTAGAGESAVYLVFGSSTINSLAAANRIGDLGMLGQTNQLNPALTPTTPATIETPGFNGLKFVTGLDTATGLGRNSGLGISVAAIGDYNNTGFNSFIIGAPHDAGRGRAFLITGGVGLLSPTLTTANSAIKTIDLEPSIGVTTTVSPTKIISFSLSTAGPSDLVGQAVAGIGNFFNSSPRTKDIAIGDPGFNTSASSTTANTGAVFAISGTFLSTLASGTNVDLATIGNTGSSGIRYLGINGGDLTGASISTAGNFDGAFAGTNPIDSLLIGAPGAIAGRAYLVYGRQNTPANSTLGITKQLSELLQTPGTNPVTTPLQGIVFTGVSAGTRLGFSVSSTGDYYNSGKDGIVIGAPGAGGGSGAVGTGYASIVALATGITTTSRPTNLAFSLDPSVVLPATTFKTTILQGANVGDLAGYSVASVGNFGGQGNGGVLVGAPGFNNLSGTAYFVPDNSVTAGVSVLGTIGSQLVITTSGPGFPAFLGASVSAVPFFVTPSTKTVDGDNAPDVIIGAPGFTLIDPVTKLPSTTRLRSGAGFAVSGTFLGLTSTTTPVVPGPGTGSTSGAVSIFTPTAAQLLAPPIFTGETAGLPYPPIDTLEHKSSYAPLPVQLAYEQFLPAQGFRAREEAYHHPGRGKSHQAPLGTILNVSAIHGSTDRYARKFTLPHHVFTRGKFHLGKPLTYTHPVKVIPRSQQTQSYQG